MNLLGMQFDPLDTPIKRRLQILIAGLWFANMLFGPPISLLLSIYILFYTNYWFIFVLYLIWAWTIDSNTCNIGGRVKKASRSYAVWNYLKDYFPYQLKAATNFELDPKRNYMICCYPHGIFATGTFLALNTDVTGIKELFPHHSPHLITLPMQFRLPFHRELMFALGSCSSSRESIEWLLKYPGGGKIVGLVIGGAAEAIYNKPGQNRIVLKNRKGFVKLAIQNGSPLIPMYSFGENEVFDQLGNSEGTWWRKFQEFMKKLTGVTPIIPMGRGLLQSSFGFVPRSTPITTIIGNPIEVEKIENPTREDVDYVHQKFTDSLIELFEHHKHKYVANPDKANLVIS